MRLPLAVLPLCLASSALAAEVNGYLDSRSQLTRVRADGVLPTDALPQLSELIEGNVQLKQTYAERGFVFADLSLFAQLAGNFDAYRKAINIQRGTEMITEVYVSRGAFLDLLTECRRDFLEHNVDMTYGTIRFIEKDAESFLAWSREPSVCIVCNLHVVHTAEGKRKAADDFRRIIDRAIRLGGRYYLTYHRWATRRQVETCYPQFVDFLRLKKKYDPSELFQSDWYRNYQTMFADKL